LPDDSTTQRWLFPGLSPRQVVTTFDEDRGSSDGGSILLKAADERLGLTRALAGCLRDERDPDRVVHELRELFQQRVFGIACGYADGNDSDRLSDDPIHKLLLDRDPVEGEALASQPTVSRFENSVCRRDLFRLGDELARRVVKRHRKRLRGRARRITIDLDQTADLAHGGQQLALFNGHYDNTCYLPRWTPQIRPPGGQPKPATTRWRSRRSMFTAWLAREASRRGSWCASSSART
jgi:hypothetical protein